MKPKALYILSPDAAGRIYGEPERRDIAALADVMGPPMSREEAEAHPEELEDVEVIFSGWGGPHIDEAFLASAPRLRAVFYGAGSIRGIVSDAFWERQVRITGAYGANAVSVSEYTLAQILLALKRAWPMARRCRRERAWAKEPVPGVYGTTVGIVSLGMVGRKVCERLQPFDLEVLAYDPFARPEDAETLGVELTGLADVFRRSPVVSLHTPKLPETIGLVTGELVGSMPEGGTLINTSRGAVVREDELIDVLRRRPDLFAVLDVTEPEPPAADSPLWEMENVVLTPHIAGALNTECRRLGRCMVEEFERYVRGEPLVYEITRERAAVLA
jgi:phosphoglycerate dehydrogenase-like enzyme